MVLLIYFLLYYLCLYVRRQSGYIDELSLVVMYLLTSKTASYFIFFCFVYFFSNFRLNRVFDDYWILHLSPAMAIASAFALSAIALASTEMRIKKKSMLKSMFAHKNQEWYFSIFLAKVMQVRGKSFHTCVLLICLYMNETNLLHRVLNYVCIKLA